MMISIEAALFGHPVTDWLGCVKAINTPEL
jgi:hypothetical protein